MSTSHIQPYGTFKIEKRDKECVLGIYRFNYGISLHSINIGLEQMHGVINLNFISNKLNMCRNL